MTEHATRTLTFGPDLAGGASDRSIACAAGAWYLALAARSDAIKSSGDRASAITSILAVEISRGDTFSLSWPRFLRRLAAIGDDAFAASPDDGDAFVDELYNTRAWNFGLVVIDLDVWKQHKLTAKYTGWLEANYHRQFFPSDSLAFGLGLPFLALRGEVECFEDDDKVLFEQGLGVTPWVYADRDTKTLDDAFALHWNGNRKPWDMDRCDDTTRPYFLRYLARSPGLYGGHVAESGGDYWAACAPPPPRYHQGLRFQRKLYGVNSVEGTAWATYLEAYVWAEDFYRYSLDHTASNISDCVAICRDLFPDVVGGGTLACPRTKLELELLRDRFWHPDWWGWTGHFSGGGAGAASFNSCPGDNGTVAAADTGLWGTADDGGACAISERCTVLPHNEWKTKKKCWDDECKKWKTGWITRKEALEDRSCGTGRYPVPPCVEINQYVGCTR